MKKLSLALLPLALLASASAAQAPGFSESERRQGAEAHPQLLQQFGGAYQGPQAAYVRQVGQKIAAQSGMAASGQAYTVTLLNSNTNNAFAIPGGYVYISRQLLALMNDEAELAFVLGHEVAHVAAQHSQKRQNRSALTGLGAAILGAVTGSNIIGGLANTGAQLYTLGFSRDQERQADSLGVRYLTQAGYDPMASADILSSLGAQTSLEARLAGTSSAPPGWLSTHPANDERVTRIRREAQSFVPRAGARTTNRDAFLNAIDGMPYDDDVNQGTIEGTSFRHSGLRLAFTAPQGFVLQNTPTAVTGARGNQGRFQFSGGQPQQGESLAGYSARVWQAAGAQAAPPVQQGRINGIDVATSQLRTRTGNAQVDATLVVYRWSNDAWYHLLMIAPAGRDPGFNQLANSVRRLTAQEAGAVKGRRVSVVRVAAGDTVQSLANRMAYDDDRLSRFLILNGLENNARLQPGQRVKLILRG
ncbi:M48 family metalloprotease [Polymorphobacter sp.]|uniref:M48 family metalloprotease n=1 Tax=Polymorphobacter sp. TaxID=1909290 RepID=UPI003F6E9C92